MLGRLCIHLLLLLSSVCSATLAFAEQHRGVGFHQLEVNDPLDQQPMAAIAFYPSQGQASPSLIDSYEVDASADTPMADGQFPLLLISHGNTGSPLALHDLATYLAKQGFIVVAVVHPGDNSQDQSRLGTLSNLYGRPLQLSAAITAAEQDPLLHANLDSSRIGVIGYSAGGESALILAGAHPQLERLREYCAAHPTDMDACTTHGELIPDRDDLQEVSDPRVSALLLMAPLGLMFGREQLEDVQAAVLMYAGDDDDLLPRAYNAGALAEELPNTPDYRLVAGAGHFIFMAPCLEQQQRDMPQLCTDAKGVNRVTIHKRINHLAAHFFANNLRNGDSQMRLSLR